MVLKLQDQMISLERRLAGEETQERALEYLLEDPTLGRLRVAAEKANEFE